MERWIPTVLITWFIYISFVIIALSYFDVNVYEFTDEQLAIINSPSNDVLTLIARFIILTSMTTEYQIVIFISTPYTVLFVLALAKALKEVIPVFPS